MKAQIRLSATLFSATLALASPNPVAGLMDTISVFSFSQTGVGEAPDTQIVHVGAQMNIRTVSTWDNGGAKASDFNTDAFTIPAAHNIIAGGGITASIVFRNEALSDSAFMDWITRNASGDTVPYNSITVGARRGNIASPGFRAHILEHAKVQIDAGAPAIFFDEINAGFSGNTYNGNEGFDDYHLRAFNHWLVQKYPSYTKADFISHYSMSASNALDPSGDLDNLTTNFNYRTYLSSHGWASTPRSTSNPLQVEWGKPADNRMKLTSTDFIETSTTNWWKEIVDSTRSYSRTKYNREILITSNGIEPFVDFNTIGMYEYNTDNNGSEAAYVPVNGTDFDGTRSLQTIFRNLRKENVSVAGNVPAVLFIDWPTTFMIRYYAFTPTRKMDYWRVVGAEAYSNGLFPAFHLRTSMPGDPTAVDMGIIDSLKNLAAYYRSHQTLYQGLVWDSLTAQVSATTVAVSSAGQPSTSRTHVFLVNHNDNHGIVIQKNLTVTLPFSKSPAGVTLYSPDEANARNLPFTYANGTLSISLDQLLYSAVIVIDTDPALVRTLEARTEQNTSFAVHGEILFRAGNAPLWIARDRDVKGRR